MAHSCMSATNSSATLAVRRLAVKYAMPARLWKQGIYAFLFLSFSGSHLPGSIEHILAFIYSAYTIMALLLESVPIFEDLDW